MVTAALYESFKYPFLIFLTIPAGLIGIFLIFYFMDIRFNSSAYLGVLFISGIVVNNAIILISRFQLNLKRKLSLKQAITEGIVQHIRPIFLTTVTTIIGFVPLVVMSNQTAGGIWYSLAVAGIGGILSSFVFILLVLPALYYLFERKNINLLQE
jgi:HAE1 family hydrophobic/amphiphilic exporter-1